MKKMNSKQITLITGTSLIIVAIIFGALIFSKLNTVEVTNDNLSSEVQDNTPVVEEIEVSEEVMPHVEVPKIQETEKEVIKDNEEVVSIDEPLPEPPEKPELEAPEGKPETTDDLEDMDKVPEYKEEDLVVETEEVVVVNEPQESTESEKVVEEESESNLVPPSENPFLNPDNAAKPKESNGEDYYEDGRKAGEGDKF
jgi:recombination DNA repair RAD52 pathway protein